MRPRFPFGRAFGGVLLAALAASLILSASFGLLGPFVFPLVYFLTALVGALVALPLYGLLYRFGAERGWMAPLAGLVAGIIGMAWFDAPASSHPLALPYWYVAAGIAGGFTFWWRMRPSLPPAAR